MNVLINTNLLFSAIIKIAEMILNPKFGSTIYGCYFSNIELFKHKDKMLKVSKLSETKFLEVMYQIIKRINFINEVNFPIEIFENAFQLTNDIDPKDTVFIAMSNFLDYELWSGDHQLIDGLRKKEYYNILKTNELLELLSQN